MSKESETLYASASSSCQPFCITHQSQTTTNMKTTIKDKTKWVEYCGIAGMTATEWLWQVLGYERDTTTRHLDVMSDLRIGGWSHSYHYAGNFRIENTQHAYEKITEEVQRLASELDKRLHDLAAVENELRGMLAEESLANT